MLNFEQYQHPTHTEESLASMPAKSPFGYYGAKLRMAHQIVKMLPPHNAWVEGFCGSAAITLARPPAPIEIINDLDNQIINLFSQLRNNPEELIRAIELTPYARAEFQAARHADPSLDPTEKARQFLVETMMTVNSTVGNKNSGFSFSNSFSRGHKEARVNRWCNLPSRLEKVVERLRGVRVENRDARELIQMFSDRPATLMYLDPPYFSKRAHGYVIDANDEKFHTDLLKICNKAKCMILISAYKSDLYTKVLNPKKWTKKEILTNTRDTTGTDHSRTEVLWMNEQFVKAKETNMVPIRITKKELATQKINPPRGKKLKIKFSS